MYSRNVHLVVLNPSDGLSHESQMGFGVKFGLCFILALFVQQLKSHTFDTSDDNCKTAVCFKKFLLKGLVHVFPDNLLSFTSSKVFMSFFL